jgi:DNA repair protein RadD
MPIHILRPYQTEAIQSIYDYFGRAEGAPVIAIPTAGGKSLIMAEFIKGAIASYPGTRIVVLAHVHELLDQNYQELLNIWPFAPAGLYSAGLGRRDVCQIMFAGIQSIYKKVYDIGPIDIIIIDEVHLVPEAETTRYQQFLKAAKVVNPHVKMVGLTATPWRSKTKIYGDGALFDELIYEADIIDLTEKGWLAPLVPKSMATKIDLTGIGTQNGDYKQDELQERCDVDATTRAALAEIYAYGQERKRWLVFCAGVSHAKHVCEAMQRDGVAAAYVTGDTPKGDRAQIVKDYRAGKYKALVNNTVYTTGFNVREVDLIADLGPTKSIVRHVQKLGRGMRVVEGKTNCVVLDFAGNIARLGPINRIKASSKINSDGTIGETPMKECPDCHSYVYAAARECPDCGHAFPEPVKEEKLERQASHLNPVEYKKPEPQTLIVMDMFYNKHEKAGGGTPSMRVTYQTGFGRGGFHYEYICFEHSGYARQKATEWWKSRGGTGYPHTIDEAIERVGELRKAKKISVVEDGKFWRVVGAELAEKVEPKTVTFAASDSDEAYQQLLDEIPF